MDVPDTHSLSLLFRLLVSHVIADFLLQTDSMVEHRFRRKWASGWLYFHGLSAGILAYVFSGIWSAIWLPFVIFISHIVIDGMKSRVEDTTCAFILDQTAHVVIIVVCWFVLDELHIPSLLSTLGPCFTRVAFWVVLFSYSLIFWPAGILIGKITQPWRRELGSNSSESLQKAGMWIGRLERILILTFVLFDHFEAIGFLIAAKSVFRFSEIKSPENRKEAEYILVGTMFSFVIAILFGLGTRWVVKTL